MQSSPYSNTSNNGLAIYFIAVAICCIVIVAALKMSEPIQEVYVPLHINLRADLYSIVEIDTIYTDDFSYKRIRYRNLPHSNHINKGVGK